MAKAAVDAEPGRLVEFETIVSPVLLQSEAGFLLHKLAFKYRNMGGRSILICAIVFP